MLYCHYPPSILEEMTKKFSAVRKIDDLPNTWELYSLLERKEDPPLLILKDMKIAKEIHEQTKEKYHEVQ